MNNPLKSKIIKRIKNEENKKNNLANLGNTMMNSNNFDIKNYINLYKKYQKKKSREQSNIYNSMTQFSTFNSKFKPINIKLDGNVTSTHYKTSSMDKDFEKNKKVNEKLNIMTSTYIGKQTKEIKDSSFYQFPPTKSSTNFVYNRNNNHNRYSLNSTNENESFNVFKAVKEIKKSFQFPKIINHKSKNNRIHKRNAYPINNKNVPLAYKDKYISSVLDSKMVISNYNYRKEFELETDNDLRSFPITTKNVALKNILIDLINNETVKLTEKEKDLKIKNEKNEKILLTDIKEFDDFTEKQKQYCRNLELYQENLQLQNEQLISELLKYKINKKNYADETQKILEQIESLRNYALFVNKVFEKDCSKYEKSIFPDYQEEKIGEYDKNIEKIKSNVINNYKIFWDKQYKEELKNELKFLNNTDSLYFRFNEIEGNIMRLLDEQFNMKKEKEKEEKKCNEILNYLKERYDNTMEEYKIYEEKLIIEQNLWNNLTEKQNEFNIEFTQFIKELFFLIVNVFGRFDKNKFDTYLLMKEKITKDNVDIYLKEGERILRDMEDYLNSKLLDIDSYKTNDTKFFNKFMNNQKKKMKEEQMFLFKKNKMANLIGKNNKIINKANKVPFILRKTEAPYHSPKKKEKKVINYSLIKKLEDDELLKYH